MQKRIGIFLPVFPNFQHSGVVETAPVTFNLHKLDVELDRI